MTKVFLVCVFLFAGAASLVAKDVPYRIAGGQEVILRLTDKGAPPAKADGITMESAGLLFDLKQGSPSMQHAFGFRLMKNAGVSRVMIEDVSDEQAVLLVDDTDPVIKDLQWLGQSAVMPVSAAEFAKKFERRITLKGFNPIKLLAADPKQSNPVVNASGSIRVYRITVFTGTSTKTILIQPSWLNAGFLNRMELAISRAERSSPEVK
jgi:hypothetical protein